MARSRSLAPFTFGPPADVNPVNQLQRLFDDVFRGIAPPVLTGAGRLAMQPPRIDVSETDRELKVRAEMPGVADQDFSVELDGDLLTIRGEKRIEDEERDERHHIVERAFGSFARTIQLPFAPKPDQVRANFENGVLTVSIPKSAEQQGTHRIQVGHGRGDGGARAEGMDRAAAGDKPGQAGASAEGGVSAPGATAAEAGGAAPEGASAPGAGPETGQQAASGRQGAAGSATQAAERSRT
jgi:HSP20 family protein